MNCRLLVCADDLTGACECAASLASTGVSTNLITDHLQLEASDFSEPTALAVNTRSRHVTAREAGARVQQVALLAAQAGVERFYKKTDSASRGHLGAELEASLAFLSPSEDPQPVAFLPAAPAAGRTVINGQLLIQGQPAHLSGFAQDPDHPVTDSRLLRVLARESRLPARLISPADIKPNLLAETEILVFEGTEDQHLDWAADLLQRAGLRLAAGTGLFVSRLSRIWNLPTNKPSPWNPPKAAPFLVNGSLSQEGLQQLRTAIGAGWESIPLTPDAIAGEPAATETMAQKIASLLAHGKPVALHSGQDRAEARQLAQSLSPPAQPANRLVRQALASVAKIVAEGLERVRPNLILSGGECAQAVLDALDLYRCRVVGQLCQGLAAIETGRIQPWSSIVTKNGAFGPPDVYPRLFETPSSA